MLCGEQSRGLPRGTRMLEWRCGSRTIGLVFKAATRTQSIMARKDLPEERAQVKELQRQLEHARAKLADAGNAGLNNCHAGVEAARPARRSPLPQGLPQPY